MKLSSAATAASIRDLNLLQDFSLVFLAGNPISSLIWGIRSLVFWEDLLWLLIQRRLLQNSQKGYSQGELGGRISFSHDSREVLLEPNLRPLAVVGRITVHDGRCNEVFQISGPSPTPSFPQLFRKWLTPATGTSSACWCPQWWAHPGWRQGLFPHIHLSCSHKRISRSSRSNAIIELFFFHH